MSTPQKNFNLSLRPQAIRIPTDLLFDHRLGPTSCIVYAQLLREAHGAPSCTILQADLAHKIGYSRQRVAQAIRRLKSSGYISSKRGPSRDPSTYLFLHYHCPA